MSVAAISNNGSGGGLTQEEHGWLEDVHDALFAMVNTSDINPEKKTTDGNAVCTCLDKARFYLPVIGYKHLYLNKAVQAAGDMIFYFADGTASETVAIPTGTGTWFGPFDIPAGAMTVGIRDTYGYSAGAKFYYSLTVN